MAMVLLSDRARLFDLRDEREALRIRLSWANDVLSKRPNLKIKRLRDVNAMNLRRVDLAIEEIEAKRKSHD